MSNLEVSLIFVDRRFLVRYLLNNLIFVMLFSNMETGKLFPV
jgi:hypothetical protein